ncbi:SMI1/KNR4 family protein [Streptomyces sp. NPDC050400]|uniref:SMI1/KNR4 family protein n=1 Tax=Streptomyces sp. NPDC050400 TaxID=3365610 RepID=UPI0037B4EB89
MTDDDLVLAVRAQVADRELPEPASADDVGVVEQVVGHPMPQLLRRLYCEVANGGFGAWDVVSLTDTGDWFSDCADITEAYSNFADPENPLPSGIVPLMDWDPNLCCREHALAPLSQSLAEWLTDWLNGAMPDGPYPNRVHVAQDCPAR